MIAIVDYKAGNAPSVYHAVARLGHEAVLARKPEEIKNATHIILPGVGRAGATMESLRGAGFVDALAERVLGRKAFYLGICVGLQLLFEHSEEDDAACLGWLRGDVARFDDARVRVPQIGWNQVVFTPKAPFAAKDNYFYFVNSYHARPADADCLWGTAEYDGPFTAGVCKNNIYATQFHVEKSGEAGLALLDGFLRLGEGDGLC